MNALHNQVVEYLATAPFPTLVALFFVENLIIFAGSLAVGQLLVRRYEGRWVNAPPDPLGNRQIGWATATVLLNTLVTVAGFWLWRLGVVRFRVDTGIGVLVDIVILTLVMDIAMYFLHRIAHHPWILPWMHQTHHDFHRPRPVDLFVLNPFECLGFGSLWLVVITVYPASWIGMSIYLALNVAFGTIGHIGVEPFPKWWMDTPVLRWVGTSTFHAQHHADLRYNYGFYTAVWDKLFGTLHPEYADTFRRAVDLDQAATAGSEN